MKVDMSAEAVTIRLKRASQLRRLCLELGKMKPVGSSNPAAANSGASDPASPRKSHERREPEKARHS